jgi:hypothetical protein
MKIKRGDRHDPLKKAYKQPAAFIHGKDTAPPKFPL